MGQEDLRDWTSHKPIREKSEVSSHSLISQVIRLPRCCLPSVAHYCICLKPRHRKNKKKSEENDLILAISQRRAQRKDRFDSVLSSIMSKCDPKGSSSSEPTEEEFEQARQRLEKKRSKNRKWFALQPPLWLVQFCFIEFVNQAYLWQIRLSDILIPSIYVRLAASVVVQVQAGIWTSCSFAETGADL